MSRSRRTLPDVARKVTRPSAVLDALSRATLASAEIERSGVTASGAPLIVFPESPSMDDDVAISAEDNYREDDEA